MIEWGGREEVAEYLFDGNKYKAKILLELMKSFIVSPSVQDFSGIEMELPEETCKWCIEGECFFCMPDSMFKCKGKCKDYKEKIDDKD